MTTSITKCEWQVIAKMTAKLRKLSKEIGDCSETETSIERPALQELIEIATDLLNYAQEVQYKHK